MKELIVYVHLMCDIILMYRFESCQSLGDKHSVITKLDNPLSHEELQEKEVLENVQGMSLVMV